MTAVAPFAPGKLGDQLEPRDVLQYLSALDEWLRERRAELDGLDQAVLALPHQEQLTADIRLCLTLWQTIKTRFELVHVTWDSGRVGPIEREKLSQLIHGRLEGQGHAAGVSLPEACKLSDALTAQLRERLQLDQSGSDALARLTALRAQAERLRDLIALESPVAQPELQSVAAGFAARIEILRDKAGRGGDVGGQLGPLESDCSLFERDLIVGRAQRQQWAVRLAEVTALRDRLVVREARVRELVAQVVATVSHPPKYAVPAVENLGPVPREPQALEKYTDTLKLVETAFDKVESAYRDALGGQK